LCNIKEVENALRWMTLGNAVGTDDINWKCLRMFGIKLFEELLKNV